MDTTNTTISRGWVGLFLNPSDREKLIKQFPPKFSKIDCDHVTMEFAISDVGIDIAWNLIYRRLKVIGYASNDAIECIVVEVNDKLLRPEGGYYHITMSYDPEKASPVDSNTLLSNGFSAVNYIELYSDTQKFKFIPFDE